MISEVMWIWVGVASLWVVLSIARRISSDHRGAPRIVDHPVGLALSHEQKDP
jgi:hypothetical protein